MIVFKILGLLLGLKFYGPQGALVGVIIGHVFDHTFSIRVSKAASNRTQRVAQQQYANHVFYDSLFSMFAKLVKADGVIKREEITAIEGIMSINLGLNRRQRKTAIQFFEQGKASQTSFHFHASQFREAFANQPSMLEAIVDILFRIAVADNELNELEERLIQSASTIFEVPEERYRQIRAFYSSAPNPSTAHLSSSIEKHYAVLGCSGTSSIPEIKKRYRELVSDYHPDKVVAKNLPEGFVEFAHHKFRDIQTAYESIKRARGFN